MAMSELLWMRQAECLGMVDAMWDENTPSAEALRMCFRCPVRRECAEYGLARVDASDAGVLGGTGMYDREKVRAGTLNLQQVWDRRLGTLVDADFEEALTEDFARTMPRLAFA